MPEKLINEIIELKERRRVLEAELGLSIEDIKVFNKNEINLIKIHKNDVHAYEQLEDVVTKLKENEEILMEQLKLKKENKT